MFEVKIKVLYRKDFDNYADWTFERNKLIYNGWIMIFDKDTDPRYFVMLKEING